MFLYSISEGAGRMLLDLMFALFALITLVRKKRTRVIRRLLLIQWRGEMLSSEDVWKYCLLPSDAGRWWQSREDGTFRQEWGERSH